MSHMVSSSMKILNLDALEVACERLGLELVRGATEYSWYSRWMNDSPMPQGFTVDDLGKCEHRIQIKGRPSNAYEIGVVKARDGSDGYQLIFDYFGSHGQALEKVAGHRLSALKTEYQVALAESVYGSEWMIERETQPDGRVRVRMHR